MRTVYIYAGHHVTEMQNGFPHTYLKGPYLVSVDKHEFIFKEINRREQKGWIIQRIFGEDLITTLAQTAFRSTILAIPAGESSTLDAVFSEREICMIKTGLKQGMGLFTTCGSAYWIAEERLWNDKCEEQPELKASIRKKSRMGIFEGLAEGPLSPYPDQPYNSAFFHEAIHVQTTHTKALVLLSGGGTFIPFSESAQQVEILATYAREELNRFGKSLEWEIAALSCTYGDGMAIALMVHPGYGPEDIHDEYSIVFSERKDDWKKIKNSLSSLDIRMQFVSDILRHFERE